MDVEQIQKINALALDLLRQGLAKDREDAVIQAEKVYKDKGAVDYNSIRNRMEKQEQDVRSVRGIESGSGGAAKQDLSQEQVKEILEQNTKFLVKKINEFQEQMKAMEAEMNKLRSLMELHKSPSVREFVGNNGSTNGNTVAAAPVDDGKPRELPGSPRELRGDNNANQKGQASHPRSGNYKQEDVSIEKFFYMGHK